jgi:hypothetical protein
MAPLKCYKDYLREELRRCEENLLTLQEGTKEYRGHVTKINSLKYTLKKKISKKVENSIDLPGNVINSIYTDR